MNEDRYREAENGLFEDAGIVPEERWLALSRIGARTRVLEYGEGVPVLFLHGGPMAAATWSYAVANLPGVRAIMVDRPGCGLSAPVPEPPDAGTLPRYLEQLTEDLLDGLDIDRAMVVGSSLGGYAATRSAMALPDRISGVFLAGHPPFVPGWTQIPFFAMLRTPVLGWLMTHLPATRAGVRLGMRQMGQRRALAAGSIPAAMLDWERAWQRHTDTLRNDAAIIRRCGTFAGGFDAGLELRAEDLGRVAGPVHLLVGSADPIGGEENGRRVAALFPAGTIEVWDGAGHLPWLDDPARLARSVESFLAQVAEAS